MIDCPAHPDRPGGFDSHQSRVVHLLLDGRVFAFLLRHHHTASHPRGTFTFVAELIAAIEAFIDGWNMLPSIQLDQNCR